MGEFRIERDERVSLELGQGDVLGVKFVGPPELVGDFLTVTTVTVVAGASGEAAAVFELPTKYFEMGAEAVLAVLAAVALTRLHSWQRLASATAMGYSFAAVTLRKG